MFSRDELEQMKFNILKQGWLNKSQALRVVEYLLSIAPVESEQVAAPVKRRGRKAKQNES